MIWYENTRPRPCPPSWVDVEQTHVTIDKHPLALEVSDPPAILTNTESDGGQSVVLHHQNNTELHPLAR